MMTISFSVYYPQITPPWTAAPKQMASSGLIPVLGSFPLKYYLTKALILGILVEPPTKTISSTSFFFKSAPYMASFRGSRVFLNKSALSSSNLALVRLSEKSNPSTKSSISILVSCWDDKALFPFSTYLFSFWMALLSFEISMLSFLLINFMKWSRTL